MYYKSTRNSEVKVSSAQAIAQGISVDGGLFVPEEIPSISMEDLKKTWRAGLPCARKIRIRQVPYQFYRG